MGKKAHAMREVYDRDSNANITEAVEALKPFEGLFKNLTARFEALSTEAVEGKFKKFFDPKNRPSNPFERIKNAAAANGILAVLRHQLKVANKNLNIIREEAMEHYNNATLPLFVKRNIARQLVERFHELTEKGRFLFGVVMRIKKANLVKENVIKPIFAGFDALGERFTKIAESAKERFADFKDMFDKREEDEDDDGDEPNEEQEDQPEEDQPEEK